MKLHNIAINNLRRRKAKMAFLMAGMIIGIATIVILYTITTGMEQEIADKFDQIGSNMTIIPESDSLSMSYEGVSAADTEGTLNLMTMDEVAKIGTIKNRENIATVAPKLLDSLKVANRNMLVIGVQFPEELRLKKWWKVEGTRPEAETDVLLGYAASGELGKKAGETLEILGRQYKVAGVIQETGSQEDSVIFMDLKNLQSVTGKKDAVSFVEVAALCYTCPIEEITAQISGKLPGTKVTAIREAVQARKDFVDRFSQLGLSVSVIILVIGALVVFITMMSSVSERTREIGIFRAIGFRKSRIIGVILMEAGMISLFGGLAGYLLGMAAARIAAPVIAQMEVVIPWDYRIGGAALAIAVLIGLMASILPALKASSQDPVEALRYM
ncbi:MAG: ABC transporter permease [Firmicutes bacterium HGW-Firmicutes-14]|jgi:putative ABC transport system permease protein|nr:MAG: ABC transporter permease [Firmicutes bacterium HGW-Firmicutes-14]